MINLNTFITIEYTTLDFIYLTGFRLKEKLLIKGLMKYLLMFLLLTAFNLYSNEIIYTDPVNNAKLINPESRITFGFKNSVNLSITEIANSIRVNGSISGTHNGIIRIAGENKKIIFIPDLPFLANEIVYVEFSGLLKDQNNRNTKISGYNFTISPIKIQYDPIKGIEKETGMDLSSMDTPPVPPALNVTVNNNPAPGKLFFAPFTALSNITILNNNGSSYWYQQRGTIAYDFKMQPNGHLTFFANNPARFIEMDENYNTVHTYSCGNGYTTDIHELKVLSNGNALLMAYDPQIVDMSHIVSGGHTDATVIGLIIQEIDQQNNVLFQWRSWDHMQITDATQENLLDSVIDYIHGNAIELDYDNNILISSRHIDEITKINHTTGDIIWRFGGKNNMFVINNDSMHFSHQHDIRRLPNGNVTLFDNGNFRFPEYSRSVEYALDETNHVATLVWQFQRNPQAVSSWGGNSQRLPNGNTLIAWGGCVNTVTEVKPDGTVVFEGSYTPGIFSYRGYKFVWPPVTTGIENGNNQPVSFRLFQNYPNPFNPVTKVKFTLVDAAMTSLTVYSINGEVVKKCFSGFLNSGEHSIDIDGTDLASGIYFYRLISGENSSSGKMMLIK